METEEIIPKNGKKNISTVIELLRKRRSIRRFKPDDVSDHTLEKLVEAAIQAPSASNKQPWRFLLTKNREVIESIARDVSEESRQIIRQMRPEFRDIFTEYADKFTIFRDAPALIIPIYRVFAGLSRTLDENVPQEERIFHRSLEHDATLLAIGMAAQNLLLMAEDLGLGACCMTGPLIARKNLSGRLDIPKGWEMAAVIAIGYSDEKPENPGRKSLISVIKWI